MQIQNEILESLELDLTEHLQNDVLKNKVLGLIVDFQNEKSVVDFLIAFEKFKAYVYCLRDCGVISYLHANQFIEKATFANQRFQSLSMSNIP